MSDATAPDGAAQRVVRVIENVSIARDTFRLRLADAEMAEAIVPGQFLMIRPTAATSTEGGAMDPLLGRPFAVYEVVRDGDGRAIALDVVYLILGRGTALMAAVRPGDCLSVWGPLGHGFGPPPPEGEVLFVAGGIGQTPFLALGRWWLGKARYGAGTRIAKPAASATLLYGVRTAALAAGVGDFEAAGISVELATDDGTVGHHGYVTDLLKQRLDRGERPAKVVGCGPSPMLRALSRIVVEAGLDADLSLESPMACGFGACFSCVVPIRQGDGSVDLRRVCVEGPIFRAADVVWEGG